MKNFPVDVIGGSKIEQALELMQSALKLLDEVECDSAAPMYLDQAIAVLSKDLQWTAPSPNSDQNRR